jgi:septal ring factor EnvC (AmiA/AmiB activator)
MNRLFAIAAVAGLLVGVLVGFLWWGMPTQRLQGELGEARKRVEALEKQVDEAQAQTRAAQADLKTVQGQLKTMEQNLALEKARRSKLEMILSQGRK